MYQEQLLEKTCSSLVLGQLAKTLLYAINGGVDEVTGAQVGPEYRPITSEVLDFEEVKHNFMNMMDWLAELYVNTLNIIHYMHDKYSYEAAQLALMDSDLQRTFCYRYCWNLSCGRQLVSHQICKKSNP